MKNLTPPLATFKKKPREFVGIFTVVSLGGEKITAKARSGQPEYQNTEWQIGLSPCPQSKNIVGSHEINLWGYNPGDTSACGDIFFPILPDPQKQKGSDGVRTEIGLHSDNNFTTAPGTAGCIGIAPEEWKKIRDALFDIRRAKYDKIPLLVEYAEEETSTGDDNPLGLLRAIYKLAEGDKVITAGLNAFTHHPDTKKFLDTYRKKEASVESPFADFNRFKKALEFTLKWEGGFVDDPDDAGGRTNYGITQATFDAYRKSKGLVPISVEFLTPEEAELIYYQNYWIPSQCSRMPSRLAPVFFDTSVNFGVGGAIEFLQEALNISVDGIWGEQTERKYSDQTIYFLNEVLPTLIIHGRKTYRHLRVKQNASQEKFLAGWLNRDNDLAEFVKRL